MNQVRSNRIISKGKNRAKPFIQVVARCEELGTADGLCIVNKLVEVDYHSGFVLVSLMQSVCQSYGIWDRTVSIRSFALTHLRGICATLSS